MYKVQRRGFDSSGHRWFDVDYQFSAKREAVQCATLRKFGNGAEHRVVDTHNGRVVWPEEE